MHRLLELVSGARQVESMLRPVLWPPHKGHHPHACMQDIVAAAVRADSGQEEEELLHALQGAEAALRSVEAELDGLEAQRAQHDAAARA